MITKAEYIQTRQKALAMLAEHRIVLTPHEEESMEIADFGLGSIESVGLQIITYINTPRVCAKELIMLPGQTCPEHMHPTIGGVPGKEETFRCRAGTVYLYVPGAPALAPACSPPESPPGAYTVWHEIVLNPGQQYTLAPDTLHWFQAGPMGAIVSEFSTTSTDEADIFTDARIVRAPEVE